MTVYAEIGTALKMKRKEDEEYLDFATRVAKKVNGLEDGDWKELSKELQVWSNEVLKAKEAAGEDTEPELPTLEGWPDAEPEEATEASEDEGDDEATEDGEDTFSEEPAEESVDESENSGQEEASDEPEEEAPAKKAKKKVAKPAPKASVKPQKSKEKLTGKGKDKDMTTTKAAAKSTKAPASQNARTRIDPKGTIKVLAKKNPHREGTKLAIYFAKYKDGMTVEAALKAKIPQKNVYYEVQKGNIKLVSVKREKAAA
jgi:hypothetical protein